MQVIVDVLLVLYLVPTIFLCMFLPLQFDNLYTLHSAMGFKATLKLLCPILLFSAVLALIWPVTLAFRLEKVYKFKLLAGKLDILDSVELEWKERERKNKLYTSL